MTYLVLMFIHVGAMFVATALAVGPAVVLFAVARSRDPAVIRPVFGQADRIFRIAGGAYGVGILFGIITAINGGTALTNGWLLLAYALIGGLLVANFGFERWTRRVEAALPDPVALTAVVGERSAALTLTGMLIFTLLIVYVMVVKPFSS